MAGQNYANDFMKGFGFAQNAMGAMEDRKANRKLRTGIEQHSAHVNTFLDPETNEMRTDAAMFEGDQASAIDYLNTYSGDLINAGVDTDKFDAKISRIHKNEDGTYVPMIRQTNKSTGEFTEGPLTRNRSKEDGDVVENMSFGALRESLRASISKNDPTFNTAYQGYRKDGAEADGVGDLINSKFNNGGGQLPMQGGNGIAATAPSYAPAQQAAPVMEEEEEEEEEEVFPVASPAGIGELTRDQMQNDPATRNRMNNTVSNNVMSARDSAIGLYDQNNPGYTEEEEEEELVRTDDMTTPPSENNSIVMPRFLEEKAGELQSSIREAQNATGRSAESAKNRIPRLEADLAKLQTRDGLIEERARLVELQSKNKGPRGANRRREQAQGIAEIDEALGGAPEAAPKVKTGQQKDITVENLGQMEPTGAAAKASQKKAEDFVAKKRNKTGVVTKEVKNMLLRLNRVNPEKYDAGWVARVMQTGKMTDLDFQKFQETQAHNKVLQQPKPVDTLAVQKERRTQMVANAKLYAASKLGYGDEKNATAKQARDVGKFVKAMDGTPWLDEKWNIDETTGVGMNVMWDAHESMERANAEGKSLFGEDETWDSLTPFIAEQFMSEKSGKDIRPLYKKLSSMPGATKAVVDEKIARAIQLHRQNKIPLDDILNAYFQAK